MGQSNECWRSGNPKLLIISSTILCSFFMCLYHVTTNYEPSSSTKRRLPAIEGNITTSSISVWVDCKDRLCYQADQPYGSSLSDVLSLFSIGRSVFSFWIKQNYERSRAKEHLGRTRLISWSNESPKFASKIVWATIIYRIAREIVHIENWIRGIRLKLGAIVMALEIYIITSKALLNWKELLFW